MATVETLRVLKPVTVGCEKHNKMEARTLGHYAPEWMSLPHNTLNRLKRNKMVEVITVEEEELVKFEELHEEVWGSEAEETPSEQGEVSEESEVETDSDETSETEEPEEIVEEDIDLGPTDEEDETEARPKKTVPRRRTPRRTRSKT